MATNMSPKAAALPEAPRHLTLAENQAAVLRSRLNRKRRREEETARIVEAFEEENEPFVSDTSDLEVLFIVMAVWRQNIIELGCFKILNSRLLSSLPTLESRNTWTTATTTSTTTSTTTTPNYHRHCCLY